MKKWIFLALLIVNVSVLLAQNKNDSSSYVTVTPGFKVKRSDRINAYADSINNYIKGSPPSFILDECFEIDNPILRGFHPTTSVRWEILEQVNNKIALKSLLHTFKKRLKQQCSFERLHIYKVKMPTVDSSFYQLMKKRYKQL